VKTQWINNGHTWEHIETICLQQPEALVAYVLHRHLREYNDWKWMQEYAKHSEHKAKITMALKVAVECRRKYKFGIEVP